MFVFFLVQDDDTCLWVSYFTSGDCYFLSSCEVVDKVEGRDDVYAQRECYAEDTTGVGGEGGKA